jgi:WD40 repeat protein
MRSNANNHPGQLDTKSPVDALDWSPEGELLAIGTKDGMVRLMDKDGTPLYRIPAFSHGVESIRFTRDGRWVVAGYRGEHCHVWETNTGQEILSIRDLDAPCGFSSDSHYLLASETGRVALCELSPPTVIRRFSEHQTSILRLAWSRDNRHFVTLDSRCEARVWDVAAGRPIHVFTAPAGDEYYADNGAVSLSDDGRLLAYASGGKDVSHVVLRDVRAGKTILHKGLPGGYEQLACVGSDQFLLAREELQPGKAPVQTMVYELSARGLDKRVLLRTSDPDEVWFYNHQLTPDGRFYCWSGPRLPLERGRLVVLDVENRREVFRQKRNPGTQNELPGVLSPDGQLLWAGLGSGGSRLFDLQDGRLRDTVPRPPVSLSRRMNWTVLTLEPDQYRTESGLALARLPHRSPLFELLNEPRRGIGPEAVGFSDDERYLAWGTRRGTVFVAEIEPMLQEIERSLRMMNPE